MSPQEELEYIALHQALAKSTSSDESGKLPDNYQGGAAGSLPISDRAKMSFTESPEEKDAYLREQYPGVKLGTFSGRKVALLPGEDKPRYYSEPGIHAEDIADYAGTVPEIAGGVIGSGAGLLGLAGGSAAGTAAKQIIGHEALGIPRIQSSGENAADIAASGVGAGLLGKAFEYLPAAKNAVGRLFGKGVSEEAAPAAEKAAAAINSGTGSGEAVVPPQSLSEIKARIADAKNKGMSLDTPQIKTLEAGEKYLPSDRQFPILEAQKEALKSKAAYAEFQTKLSDPSVPGAKEIGEYAQGQKQELGRILDKTVNDFAGREPIPNSVASGQSAIDTFNSNYQANKANFGKMINQYVNTPIDPNAHMDEFREKLLNAWPRFKKFIDPETGKMASWDPGSGIPKDVYKMLSDSIDFANRPGVTLPEIQGTREYLRQQIANKYGGSASPINAVRKAMLDHMQDVVQATEPDANVRGAFQGYAKNEANFEAMEKFLHGGLDKFDPKAKQVIPELALDKLFANSKSAESLKTAFAPDQLRGISGDFIQHLREKSTSPDGVFSSAKFSKALRDRAGALQEVFKDNPLALKRIQAVADHMRLVPDAPMFNTSGTAPAKSILDRAKNMGHFAGKMAERPAEAMADVGEKAKTFLERRKAASELENMLKPEAQRKAEEKAAQNNIFGLLPNQRRILGAFGGSRAAQGLLQRNRENR